MSTLENDVLIPKCNLLHNHESQRGFQLKRWTRSDLEQSAANGQCHHGFRAPVPGRRAGQKRKPPGSGHSGWEQRRSCFFQPKSEGITAVIIRVGEDGFLMRPLDQSDVVCGSCLGPPGKPRLSTYGVLGLIWTSDTSPGWEASLGQMPTSPRLAQEQRLYFEPLLGL